MNGSALGSTDKGELGNDQKGGQEVNGETSSVDEDVPGIESGSPRSRPSAVHRRPGRRPAAMTPLVQVDVERLKVHGVRTRLPRLRE